MKWFYRIFTFALLGAALIVPYFMKQPDGKPVMELPTAKDFIPEKLIPGDAQAPITSSNQQTVYKWQDAQGQWHYGDQPPSDSSKVSTLQVDTNTNIIQSLKIEPEVKDEPQTIQAQQQLPERLSGGDLSLDNAVNALNDAKLVRDLMESRNDALKNIVGE